MHSARAHHSVTLQCYASVGRFQTGVLCGSQRMEKMSCRSLVTPQRPQKGCSAPCAWPRSIPAHLATARTCVPCSSWLVGSCLRFNYFSTAWAVLRASAERDFLAGSKWQRYRSPLLAGDTDSIRQRTGSAGCFIAESLWKRTSQQYQVCTSKTHDLAQVTVTKQSRHLLL